MKEPDLKVVFLFSGQKICSSDNAKKKKKENYVVVTGACVLQACV